MTESETIKIGGILLAAGGSRRMGRPKQLVEFDGSTLLRRAAKSLAASDCDPKAVVLGADAGACKDALSGLGLTVCLNPEWKNGISWSIKTGLRHILEAEPAAAAVIITLCDQPFVTSEVINRFIAEYRRIRTPVIAAEYNAVCGVPALFSVEMFDDLFQLKGDKGAQSVIRKAGPKLLRINVPDAAFDIDSPEDLTLLREVSG